MTNNAGMEMGEFLTAGFFNLVKILMSIYFQKADSGCI